VSKPEIIKIDDVEYVRSDKQKAFDGDIKIVVADRGFVYVGVVEEMDVFNRLKDAGLASREYSGPAGFLGVARLRLSMANAS